MQIIDLCSGIGGFSLAGHSLGWETILFCEKEPFPRSVLKDKFPGIPVFEDVFKLTKQDIDGLIQPNRPVIQLCGWPCQPFSVAGARQGTEDSRHLWPEMYRIIKEIRPDYIIGENVPGLLSIEGGVVFQQVCLDLESEGYEVQAFVLPACATGAPHRRDRVWITAYSNEVRRGSGFGSIPEANGEISEWHENAESCNASSRSSQNSGSSGCPDGINEQQKSFGEFGKSGTGSHERNISGEDAGTTTDTASNGHSGGCTEAGAKVGESQQRGMFKPSGSSAGANGNTEHNGPPSEQELRGNEETGNNGRKEEQTTPKQSPGTDRPNDATSVHRSEVGVEWTTTDTSIQGHQGSEQPRTHGERPEPSEPHRPVAELHSGNYWANWPSISPFHTGYDGLSPELVRHIRTSLSEVGQTPEQIEAYLRKESNWLRKEAIKCAGNAIVPQVVLEVMKAIQNHYENTKY